VLGQSSDAAFERHYQSQLISCDLQHVVLLRPSQESLVRVAGSMLRKRDPLAPSGLATSRNVLFVETPESWSLDESGGS
jgi:hypothetical protein